MKNLPRGRNTVPPPWATTASYAAWTAEVSSFAPSPTAPKSYGFFAVLGELVVPSSSGVLLVSVQAVVKMETSTAAPTATAEFNSARRLMGGTDQISLLKLLLTWRHAVEAF